MEWPSAIRTTPFGSCSLSVLSDQSSNGPSIPYQQYNCKQQQWQQHQYHRNFHWLGCQDFSSSVKEDFGNGTCGWKKAKHYIDVTSFHTIKNVFADCWIYTFLLAFRFRVFKVIIMIITTIMAIICMLPLWQPNSIPHGHDSTWTICCSTFVTLPILVWMIPTFPRIDKRIGFWDNHGPVVSYRQKILPMVVMKSRLVKPFMCMKRWPCLVQQW